MKEIAGKEGAACAPIARQRRHSVLRAPCRVAGWDRNRHRIYISMRANEKNSKERVKQFPFHRLIQVCSDSFGSPRGAPSSVFCAFSDNLDATLTVAPAPPVKKPQFCRPAAKLRRTGARLARVVSSPKLVRESAAGQDTPTPSHTTILFLRLGTCHGWNVASDRRRISARVARGG